MRNFSKSIFFILGFSCLISCHTEQHDKKSVEAAMKLYDHLIKKMDTDSIALLYTVEGNLGRTVHGRDSIRKFLSGFAAFHVLNQSSASNSVKISGDTARQEGNYRQTVILPSKDTVTVSGRYDAVWLWTRNSGWLLRSMETTPSK